MDKNYHSGRRGFIKTLGAGGLGLGLSYVSCTSTKSLPDTTVPLAQDYSVVLHNPDRELYIEGCGLVRMSEGPLVAVVPVITRGVFRKERSVYKTNIIRSPDDGLNWQPVATLPYYSAVPWLYRDTLYLFAMEGDFRHSGLSDYRNDNLFLLKSDDMGQTWSDPVLLFKGHFWNCHTGMVIRNNHLYWAVCDLAAGPRGPRVVSCDLSKEPMDPLAWRISNAVPFPGMPSEMIYPGFADIRSSYLEPNVIDVGGQLRLVSCVKPAHQGTAGLAAVLDFTDNGHQIELCFTQYHPRPGGQLKFFILWDEVSKLFWSTANLVVDSQGQFSWWEEGREKGCYRGYHGGNDRRFLMLFYGIDGLNWFQAGCIAQATKISRSFMYATPVIDGDDLAIISRSSVNAPNQHDADYATFHRIKNFRRLAGLKLIPGPESKSMTT